MIQTFLPKKIKTEAGAKACVDIPKLASSITEFLKMEAATYVFVTMTVAIESEVFYEILIQLRFGKELIVVAYVLQESLTAYGLSYLLYHCVLLNLCVGLRISKQF